MIKIKNNFQLAASRKWLTQFERSLEDAKHNSRNLHPRLHQAQVEGIRSQINDLKREIDEYESLRDAQPGDVIVESLEDLPDALIRVRIARHLTQEHLAEKLGVRPQQVQKWEAGAYQRASYASILKVARALGIEMEGTTL
jgi:DNA-binding XRE family transcriptional regulator